jgi:hypothetical protein
MSGWIKLQRQILDHWIAQDNEYLAVWVRMLAEANFDSRKTVIGGVLVEVKRGQLIFGLESYSAKTGVSIRRLRKLLELLESDGMIDRQKNNKFSLITIANYEKHQDEGRQESGKGQANDNQKSSAGQAQVNTIRSKELKKVRNEEKDNNAVAFDFSTWPEMPSPQLLDDWIKVRKSKRAAITQTAIKTIGRELQKAADMGFSVETALSIAVSSGWQGFKADWLKDKTTHTKSDINQIANAALEYLNERQ